MKPENQKQNQGGALRITTASLVAILGGVLALDSQFSLLTGNSQQAIPLAVFSGICFMVSEIVATQKTLQELSFGYLGKKGNDLFDCLSMRLCTWKFLRI